jgi:hypothetical protein
MHVISAIALSLLLAAPAQAATTPLQRETAVWDAVKARQMTVFAQSMAPDFVGVYAFGRHDRARELQVVREQRLRSFAIRNFRAKMLDADDMLMTYTADVRGTDGGESFSGRYWNTSLWHRSGGKWLTAYHSEAKVK